MKIPSQSKYDIRRSLQYFVTTSGQNCGKGFFLELLCVDNAHININIKSLLPPSRSSSKYDLRGKCRRTCIRQGTRYGRAIAPTLMELLHDHPTIYNTSTSALLPAQKSRYFLLPNSPRHKNISH